MNGRRYYELDVRCELCQHPFGDHCAADDGCPIYETRLSGRKHLADWSKSQRFQNLFATPTRVVE